ncbi:STAS domain-containing protein [Bacilliculturomica massiliensis]|uniref:STAS domain-containing protein n=1 Tax=Bacilliculturomica massiliensis TaxID=1917867 RepID=UPI0010313E14|nr:anti-sigma factor antagonist [Bacilliculturomica massiliensis]
MRILNEMTDDILIARLEGELDHHSAAEVRSAIDETLDAFCGRHLIFCFEKVSFMDSAGIGVVMGRYNKVRENGGMVFVTDCSEYVERILSMAGIFTIAGYCRTAEEAIAQCRKITREEEQTEIQKG